MGMNTKAVEVFSHISHPTIHKLLGFIVHSTKKIKVRKPTGAATLAHHVAKILCINLQCTLPLSCDKIGIPEASYFCAQINHGQFIGLPLNWTHWLLKSARCLQMWLVQVHRAGNAYLHARMCSQRREYRQCPWVVRVVLCSFVSLHCGGRITAFQGSVICPGRGACQLAAICVVCGSNCRMLLTMQKTGHKALCFLFSFLPRCVDYTWYWMPAESILVHVRVLGVSAATGFLICWCQVVSVGRCSGYERPLRHLYFMPSNFY